MEVAAGVYAKSSALAHFPQGSAEKDRQTCVFNRTLSMNIFLIATIFTKARQSPQELRVVLSSPH
jgi:hypothetical protein